MSNRTNIPMKYLRHIAHQLITSTHEAKRTDTRRPRSKTAVLRELMKSDSELYGKVVAMYRRMLTDELKADMLRDGLVVTANTDEYNSWWKERTPEERRSWRLCWAREQLKGFIVGNLDGFGGQITGEELALAQSTLDGAPIPAELVGVGAFAEFME